MSMRAAMLTVGPGARNAALLAALTQGGELAEVRLMSTGGTPTLRTAMRLAAYRPDVVIADADESCLFLGAAYRILARRSRLLVRLGATHGRDNGLRRALLGRADGLLSDDDTQESLVERLREQGPQVFPLSAPRGLEPFLAQPLTRLPPQEFRILIASPLSPQSGVADILLCIAAWAERHPERKVEVWWAGEGDLAGVLDAQPLPDNMAQRFLGALSLADSAETFAQCGLMILPLRPAPGASPVAEALAAGLVVIASERDRLAHPLLAGERVGWTFDPARPDAMLAAVSMALDSTPEALSKMRTKGRTLVCHSASQGVADRLRAVMATIMPQPAAAARPGPAAMEPQ